MHKPDVMTARQAPWTSAYMVVYEALNLAIAFFMSFPGRAPRLPEGLPHRPGRAQLTHPVPRDMRLLKAQAYLHTPNEYSMTESFTRRRRTSFVPYTSPSHTQCAPAMLTRLSAALSPLPCWPAARSCLGRSPWLLTGSSRVELPCFQSLL